LLFHQSLSTSRCPTLPAMRAELPTGTVTFLFTDIEGSTRLLHALGPEAYAAALAEHRRALREAFAAHNGVEVDTQGDAFLVAFPTAQDAAAAARRGRDALAGGSIRVRMGLHTGTPLLAAEGYVGIDVHRGARVGALAHGGQILLSPATAGLLDGEPLLDLGSHRLKDFEGATRLYQLDERRFPPLRTPGSVDLPAPASRFLGRERELFDAISIVLDRDPRVLTIVGPGGTGKTRFAIELARLMAEEAEGSTLFVPLAPLRDAGLVLPAVAEKLGTPSPEPDALAAATSRLRTHLVLDNAEHLLPEAASHIAEFVAAAPSVRLLVTSREPLRIQGEVELDLAPLVEDEAVALFVERAQDVRPDIRATPAVEELCGRLDRLPLALELAAARTKALSPEQLLERVGQRLDLLRGTREADERHTTLRATIAWSYDLLEPDERKLFERLSVFAAGCTLESAEAVCDADLDALASLLDKSLLRRRTGRLGEERYWMLETIRQFAHERLVDSGEVGDVRRRHASEMLATARAAHLMEEDHERPQLSLVLAERDDLRAALDWAAGADRELALELAIALENFWVAHAPHEGARRLRELLEGEVELPTALRAQALRVYGGALDMAGHRDDAERRYAASLDLWRSLGDERAVASLLHRLSTSALWHGDNERALALATESAELAAGRFPFVEIPNYSVLGQVLVSSGEVERGTELVRRSADMAIDVGWDWWRSGQLSNLAFLALDRGDVDEAERDGREGLRIVRDQENRQWTLWLLSALARAALARDRHELAGLLWGAVEAETERVPSGSWQTRRREMAGALLEETTPEFVASVEEGRRLDLWDAAAIALGEEA
jgi:predicted ATPase/class 3 adenylate cyclase